MTVFRRLGDMVVDAGMGLPLRSAEYRVERGLAVPMPDGVSLVGDLYRPVGDERRPTVLIRLPYGRGGLYGAVFVATYARRGFQVFVQSTRGTFGSGGQFRPFTTEKEDGLATLAWVREQPWSDGRVAMTGGSYFGHTQWAVALYADPPLVAVSPHITASRITSAFYDHDAPGLDNALSWSASIGKQERRGLPFSNRYRKSLHKLPLQALDTEVAGAPVTFWRDFVGHAEPGDPFWAVADHDHADFTKMPPVSMVTGWWDLFVAGQMRDYAALREAGVPARIIVGPWRHGDPGEIKAILRSDAEWLDHHLNDGPTPKGAPVRLFLQNTNTWLEFEEWPPPSRPYEFDLGNGTFTYDPADPTPTVGGPMLSPPGKQADNASIESRDDVLVFTGEPLTENLDIAGEVEATVYLKTELPYADVFVRLCDVDERGVSRNVVDSIRRLTPDNTMGDDEKLAMQLFPTAYRFKAGHRLRVQVSGGAFPRFARNLGTGEPLGTGVHGRTNRFELFHDEARPSHLTLPRL